MIELIDTLPDVSVEPAEYKRLLGYPRDAVLSGRARELVDWARAWYLKNGRPWVFARQVENLVAQNGSVTIDGTAFQSAKLQTTLKQADAHSAILVAVSAGPEIETHAQQLWREEKPDEYFFLEIYGSAIVEHLTMMTGARLCAWAERQSMAVLPHYSPGYVEWDISEQPKLFDLIRSAKPDLPGALSVLESGMLKPKKSLLAVFGLTRRMELFRKLSDLVPCENCSFAPCQYRRAPYARAPEHSRKEIDSVSSEALPEPEVVTAPSLDQNARYVTNVKALHRWMSERLTLTDHPDGSIDALFVYDGTTCTNMGRAMKFHYTLRLSPASRGYVVEHQSCRPAPGDEGHTYMCRYMTNSEHLMVAIDNEKPLAGMPLNDVLNWSRPITGAGCYCEPQDRKHKWGLVLETVHYALAKREES